MTRLLILLFLLLATPAWAATTWYVRPADDGNGTDLNYGAEDGTSYATAFDGFADIAGIAAGDTVCLSASTEPYFERLDTGTAGSAGLPVTYLGCGVDQALIWSAQGLSGTRSFDAARAAITGAAYAWESVSTDIYKKRIDVRATMLWEDSTWLQPVDIDQASEATVLTTLEAGQWGMRDPGGGTYLIYYRATVPAKSPTTTVIRCDDIPNSAGAAAWQVRVDVAWNVLNNIEVRGYTNTANEQALGIINASNIILRDMLFFRNEYGPVLRTDASAISNILWDTVSVLYSSGTGAYIQGGTNGVTNFTISGGEYSYSTGSTYNGTNFTVGDGDGIGVGQAGGNLTNLRIERVTLQGNAAYGVFIGTANAQVVTNVDILGAQATGNGLGCFGEPTTSQIGGRLTIAGFLCTGLTSTAGNAYGIHLGTAPPAVRTVTIANGTFSNNTTIYNILFRPHADNNMIFENLVFVNSPQTALSYDIYSNEIAAVGDEIFRNIYFYGRVANQASARFAKLGSTSYFYNVGGDPAAFIAATGGTGINVNVDPQLVSTTDLRTAGGSPLRRAGTSYTPCMDARGRVCWTPPDIGAYQATHGDLVTARTAATARATRETP